MPRKLVALFALKLVLIAAVVAYVVVALG